MGEATSQKTQETHATAVGEATRGAGASQSKKPRRKKKKKIPDLDGCQRRQAAVIVVQKSSIRR